MMDEFFIKCKYAFCRQCFLDNIGIKFVVYKNIFSKKCTYVLLISISLHVTLFITLQFQIFEIQTLRQSSISTKEGNLQISSKHNDCNYIPHDVILNFCTCSCAFSVVVIEEFKEARVVILLLVNCPIFA